MQVALAVSVDHVTSLAQQVGADDPDGFSTDQPCHLGVWCEVFQPQGHERRTNRLAMMTQEEPERNKSPQDQTMRYTHKQTLNHPRKIVGGQT